MKRSANILAVLLVAMLGGCVMWPWPHRAADTPLVVGNVMNGGVPMRGLPLLLASGREGVPCEGETSVVETGQGGEFAFEQHTHFSGWLVVMAHCFYPWSVCVESGDGWEPIFKAKDYTLCDSGPQWETTLDCDLSVKDRGRLCTAKENWVDKGDS